MVIGYLECIAMVSDPLILFCLIIAGFFIAAYLYLGYLQFTVWLFRKYRLFIMGCKLLRAKDKQIKAIGWMTLRLVLWELEDDEPKS